jgi:hypothetical protein
VVRNQSPYFVGQELRSKLGSRIAEEASQARRPPSYMPAPRALELQMLRLLADRYRLIVTTLRTGPPATRRPCFEQEALICCPPLDGVTCTPCCVCQVSRVWLHDRHLFAHRASFAQTGERARIIRHRQSTLTKLLLHPIGRQLGIQQPPTAET